MLRTCISTALFVLMAAAIPTLAADLPPPPSDLEMVIAKANAAEAQVRYLSMLLTRQATQEKATAEWWAEVWKALPTHE